MARLEDTLGETPSTGLNQMSEHLTEQDINRVVAALKKENEAAMPLGAASRWVLGVAAVLLTAALTALTAKVNDLDRALAVLATEVIQMRRVMEMDGSFTRSDALALDQLHSQRLRALEVGQEKLDARVSSLEAQK